MFDAKKVKIEKSVEARKEKIANGDAWQLLSGAKEIIVGRGKKFQIFDPKKDDKEEILKVCLGRTGNLRAPTLKIGDQFVVGFSDSMYDKYIG